MKTTADFSNQDLVQLEISVKKLESLFNSGDLCAADIRCLNCTSKTCIWNLCLTSCAKRMQYKVVDRTSTLCCQETTKHVCDDAKVRIGVKSRHLKHVQ